MCVCVCVCICVSVCCLDHIQQLWQDGTVENTDFGYILDLALKPTLLYSLESTVLLEPHIC